MPPQVAAFFTSPMFTAINTAFSVVGALSSANQQASAARYNAKVAEQNAMISRNQASAEAARQQRIAMKTMGAMKAGYGASGVTLEGSPLDVIAESAANSKLDELNIKYNGELQALGFQNTANLERARAKNAMTAGVIGAGSSLLAGAAKLGVSKSADVSESYGRSFEASSFYDGSPRYDLYASSRLPNKFYE